METFSHVAIRRKGELTMDLLKLFCLRQSVKAIATSPRLPSPTSPNPSAQKSDVCAGCEKTISTGTVILAMEKTWHMSCFRWARGNEQGGRARWWYVTVACRECSVCLVSANVPPVLLHCWARLCVSASLKHPPLADVCVDGQLLICVPTV